MSNHSKPIEPGQAIRAERDHPTDTFVAFETDEIEQSILQRFEKIVRRYPDRLAVKMGDRSLTYDGLNKIANRTARAILEQRGPGNEPIALLFEHGIDIIAALFGVMKAGKFYVALDPSFPEERIQNILSDCGARLLLANHRNLPLGEKLADARKLLNFDEIDPALPADNLDLSIAPTDLALMTYTSGSTGKPKGFAREHRKAVYRQRLKTEELPIATTDRLSLLHSVVFGSANNFLYQSLLNGASLFPFNVKVDGVDRMPRWLREEGITMLHSPVAVFRQLAELLSNEEKPPALRLLRLSGSAITRQDFELYKQAFSPDTALEINMGSTEAGKIGHALVDHSFAYPAEGVPVGYPGPGKKVFLVDEAGREVAAGEVGEIAVKSRHLHSGYWKQEELTREKFLPDPAGGEERTYLTGDLGKILPDGFLIHLGRKDFMVKIRGYRVEIGEVQAALRTHPELKDACVVA
ncbi:MAG: AMP-binding protein, partial [Candidatus Binatia bacterium]